MLISSSRSFFDDVTVSVVGAQTLTSPPRRNRNVAAPLTAVMDAPLITLIPLPAMVTEPLTTASDASTSPTGLGSAGASTLPLFPAELALVCPAAGELCPTARPGAPSAHKNNAIKTESFIGMPRARPNPRRALQADG